VFKALEKESISRVPLAFVIPIWEMITKVKMKFGVFNKLLHAVTDAFQIMSPSGQTKH
jgi:hypothetical protein